MENKLDLGQACLQSGITEKANLGAQEGLIGILTSGRLTRKEYTKQSIVTALVRLEHEKWFAGEKLVEANLVKTQ